MLPRVVNVVSWSSIKHGICEHTRAMVIDRLEDKDMQSL